MEAFYPLTFRENVHTKLWGSESWVISAHPSAPSVVAEGAFAGRTLADLTRTYGAAFVGTKAPDPTSFPLLFKVIDAKDRLSVQVHPNEQTRALTGGDPKTEMWYALGGDGPIFAGLKPGTTPARVAEDVRTGRFEDTLVRHSCRPGLTLFIPGGLVHAIGERVRVYEVQQSSDTTYRLYDWGRVGTDGRPRELHVEASLKSIDFTLPAPEPQTDVSCPFFHFRPVVVNGTFDVSANAETFTAVFDVETERSVLVPANCAASIPVRGTALVTTLA